ncbi:hypothetical protein DRN75_04345, partial [Nanoarchaeota archaeon]
GFGVVMQKILTGLFRQYPGKYEVFQVGINYNGDAFDEFAVTGGPSNGRYRQWPAMQFGSTSHHMYGQQKFLQVLRSLQVDIDVVFLFEDPFWVGGPVLGTNPPQAFITEIRKILHQRGMAHVPIVTYFPIDGKPKKRWIDLIATADFPITYLNFGAEACKAITPSIAPKLQVIPHGIDIKEFYPITKAEQRTFRRVMFGDEFVDKFMFLNVNRNQLRKLIPSTLTAFKQFQVLTNNAGFIYLNMKPVDVGWDLFETCKALELVVGRDVLFPPNFNEKKGITLDELNKIFNCADLYVSTAVGGGWELSVTQAFATKLPVLLPANTSHVELCGPQNPEERRGVLFKSGDILSHTMIFPGDNEVVRPLPNLEDMVDSMVFLYKNKDAREKMAENAYKWVISELQWEKAVVPLFDRVLSEAKEVKVTKQDMHRAAAEAQQGELKRYVAK